MTDSLAIHTSGLTKSYGQFLACGTQSLYQIVGAQDGGAQPLHRTSSLGKGLVALIENLFDRAFCFAGLGR